MNSWSSSAVTEVPVGLLGVQTRITLVRSVTAAAMAGRSWRSFSSSGTCTALAPASPVRIGYASKERHAKTTSSPSSHTARMIWEATSTEPLPKLTEEGSTPQRLATASVTAWQVMSG